MKYLFWNAGQKSIDEHLQRLILYLECDIIGLAEYSDNKIECILITHSIQITL